MAKTAMQKAKARRLCEWDGKSDESIADLVPCSRRSITNWKTEDKTNGDPWLKGRFSQELRQREASATVKAIEAKGWDRGRVLAELGILAGSDIADYVDVLEDGTTRIKDIKGLGDLSRAIKSIKGKTIRRLDNKARRGKPKAILEDSTLELVLHDKRAALVDIGRELGMFRTEAEKMAEAGIFAYYRERAAEKRKGKS